MRGRTARRGQRRRRDRHAAQAAGPSLSRIPCSTATNGDSGPFSHDLRALLRSGASGPEISAAIGGIWRMREDRYSELRTAATAGLPKVEMSYIGG